MAYVHKGMTQSDLILAISHWQEFSDAEKLMFAQLTYDKIKAAHELLGELEIGTKEGHIGGLLGEVCKITSQHLRAALEK